ncbi:hypothetical protein DFQ30_001963, partial [Apophysomyces sp. BC1015]
VNYLVQRYAIRNKERMDAAISKASEILLASGDRSPFDIDTQDDSFTMMEVDLPELLELYAVDKQELISTLTVAILQVEVDKAKGAMLTVALCISSSILSASKIAALNCSHFSCTIYSISLACTSVSSTGNVVVVESEL